MHESTFIDTLNSELNDEDFQRCFSGFNLSLLVEAPQRRVYIDQK